MGFSRRTIPLKTFFGTATAGFCCAMTDLDKQDNARLAILASIFERKMLGENEIAKAMSIRCLILRCDFRKLGDGIFKAHNTLEDLFRDCNSRKLSMV
jgi:hypothetical protein